MKGFWKSLAALLLCSAPFTMCKEKEEVRIEAQAVKLDKSTLTLTVGETMKLSAEVTPKEAADKTIIWESSAPTVATVEHGTVTAKSEGTAEVTAKCGKVKATCSITVKTKVIKVESITLDKTNAELKIGEKIKLMASVMPKEAPQTIVWKSSNPEVASVSEGEITAITKGNATITAQAGDKQAKCEIVVKEIEVESITLDKTNAELKIGEKIKLIASIMPKEAPQTVVWKSSNPEVASVNEGEITAIAKGNATITAQAGDKQAKCEIVVKAPMEFKMSVSNLQALEGEFKIESPDPNMTYVYTILRKAMCDEIEQRHGDLIKANLSFWKEFGENTFKASLMKGTQTGKLSEEISSDQCVWPDTEYVFYAFGMNEQKEVTAPLQKLHFKSKPSVQSNLTFDFQMKEITSTDLLGTIKPSNNDKYYITMQKKSFVNSYKRKADQGEKIEGISPIDFMILKCIYSDRQVKSLDELLLSGNVELTEGYFKNKKPYTEYVLIMVGMDKDKGITTAPTYYEFRTAKSGQ